MSSIIDTGFISTAELKNVGYINKVENVNWIGHRNELKSSRFELLTRYGGQFTIST